MLLFLCYVCPPFAVLLMGRPFSAFVNLIMTAFGWVPGVRHALVMYADHKGTKAVKQVVGAINHPKWTQEKSGRPVPGVAMKRGKWKEEPVIVNSPHVGMNGTQFRRKNAN